MPSLRLLRRPSFPFVLLVMTLLMVSGGRHADRYSLSTPVSDIVINEVYYLGNVPADDWIELRNSGSEIIDVSNLWFCARLSYARLGTLTILQGDDYVMMPDEVLVLRVWGLGVGLNNSSSDLGLYLSTLFSSPSEMRDFVQYGSSTPIGRSPVAFGAGLWSRTSSTVYDFVPTAPAGESLAYQGTNGGGGLLTLSSDFQNGPPSQGVVPTHDSTWGRVKSLFSGGE